MIPTNDSSHNWEIIIQIAEGTGMDAEDMLRALTDWYGMQLLTKEFTEQFIEDYGY